MTQENKATLKVSETFISIQGEGPYTGHPMVFVRLFGCNFTCAGFSNRDGLPIDSGAGGNELPNRGCDSIYSWHPDYKDTVLRYSPMSLLSILVAELPGNTWANPNSGISPILCFTGGEPMLQQKAIGEFIDYLMSIYYSGITTLLFETNCSIKVSDLFAHKMEQWLSQDLSRRIVWANSPKLQNSGEPKDKAIRPEVYLSQQLTTVLASQITQYLKFVSDGSLNSFAEINEVVDEFSGTLIPMGLPSIHPGEVFIMPEGADCAQQELLLKKVAENCLRFGYMFCARVHVWIWGATKGT